MFRQHLFYRSVQLNWGRTVSPEQTLSETVKPRIRLSVYVGSNGRGRDISCKCCYYVACSKMFTLNLSLFIVGDTSESSDDDDDESEGESESESEESKLNNIF